MKSLLFFCSLLLSNAIYGQIDSAGVMHPRIDPRTGKWDSTTVAWFKNEHDEYWKKNDSSKLSDYERIESASALARRNPFFSTRKGNGDNSFNVTEPYVEELIKTGTTVRQFEQKLGKWITDSVDNYISMGWEKNAVPQYEIYYNTTWRGSNCVVKITAKGINNRIQEMKITTSLSRIQLSNFEQVLINKGYKVDKVLSRVFGAVTWKINKRSGIVFSINEHGGNSVSIGVF